MGFTPCTIIEIGPIVPAESQKSFKAFKSLDLKAFYFPEAPGRSAFFFYIGYKGSIAKPCVNHPQTRSKYIQSTTTCSQAFKTSETQ